MEKKKRFLVGFIKFGGILEIAIGIGMFFMGYFEQIYEFGTDSLPLFYQFAGVELLILGYLLWYSARDIERYKVIIIASCIFRFIMPLWPEMQAMITLWPHLLAITIIPGIIYDLASASLTLVLLKQLGYLKKN